MQASANRTTHESSNRPWEWKETVLTRERDSSVGPQIVSRVEAERHRVYRGGSRGGEVPPYVVEQVPMG